MDRQRRIANFQFGGGWNNISPPSGFTAYGNLPFNIQKNGDSFRIDPSFDLRNYSGIDSITSGTDYYIDPINGDDTTGLSFAHAYKDIFSGAGRADARIIYIKSGFYHNNVNAGAWQGLSNAKAIICVGDTPAILCRSRSQNFISTGTHYNSTSTTQIVAVYDLLYKNSDGSYLSYTLVENQATVESTTGTFYWSANVLSVKTIDNRIPDSNIIAVIAGVNWTYTVTSPKTIYMENLKFLFNGAGGSFSTLRGNGAQLNAYFKNCIWSHGLEGHNITVLGLVNCIFQNCISEYSYNDGFNYHISTTLPKSIEINCIGKYAGWKSGGGSTNNGSSVHDNIPIVRINGEYSYCCGANVGDVGGGQSWNLGCKSHHSQSSVLTRNVGFLAGNSGATFMALDNCYAHDNLYDLAPIEGKTINIKNFKRGAYQDYADGQNGKIIPY